jgi:hypothetical protein
MINMTEAERIEIEYPFQSKFWQTVTGGVQVCLAAASFHGNSTTEPYMVALDWFDAMQ